MKRNSIHAALFAALSSILLSGCISDADTGSDPAGGTAVKFSTIISMTRAYDDIWEYGDYIGVYMVPAAGAAAEPAEPGWSSITMHAENRRYALDLEEDEQAASVIFSGDGDENIITWPADGAPVDIVAYYPWREEGDGLSGYVYQIDISGQDPQREIDLMWSNNVENVNSGTPALQFEHKLSKLVFNVTDLGNGSLQGMTSTFDGLPTVAAFDLSTGETVADSQGWPSGEPVSFDGYLAPWPETEEEADYSKARIEAIVLPGEAEYTLTFRIDGKEAVFNVKNANYKAGRKYTYDISLKPDEIGFGDGETPNTIDGWEEGDADDHGVVTDPGDNSGDGSSGTWESGPLDNDPDNEYTVTTIEGNEAEIEDGGYRMSSNSKMKIVKENHAGVTSVSLWARCNMTVSGRIESVKVGDVELAQGGRNLAFNSTSLEYRFETPDGEPISGNVEIVIGVTTGPVWVNSFAIND